MVGSAPHAATFGRVLAAVDPAALQRTLTVWVMGRPAIRRQQHVDHARPGSEDRTVLAVDGKTLRGTRRPDGAQTKLISIYEHDHRLMLAPVGVADGDEIAAFTTAWPPCPTCAE